MNARAAPCVHIVDRRRSGVAVRGVGGVKVRSYGLVLCSIVMLLFRPYSYGHRANPEFADLSSRSLRNADGRFHRRIGQLDGGVKPEKVGREYAWQSWPEVGEWRGFQQLPLVFPIPLHLLLITVSTSFFMLPRVATGARLRLMSTMAQSLTPMEDAMRAKETNTLAFNIAAPRITIF